MKGRLLEAELEDPYSNLALEEALFRTSKVPTLRVWENQQSVVIGRAQLAAFETDLAYCRRTGIPVVRRFTAGGAVYHGPGNLNWSFFIPGRYFQEGPWDTRDANRVFDSFAGLVVGALQRCGVEAAFRRPNSLTDNRGKICGMAAYISRDGVLCHGTLLIDADLDLAERLTRPSRRRLQRRYPRNKFVKISNCGVEREKFVRELRSADGLELERRSLGRDELASASKMESKYRSERWNLGDPFELDNH